MKWIIFILVFKISFLQAQNNPYKSEYTYSKKSLNEDFTLFYNTLLEVHPSVFDFISQDSLAIIYNQIKGSIEAGTEIYFYNKISYVLAKVGCGHTVARPSGNWYNAVKKNPKIISLSIKLIDGELYFWNQPYEDSITLRGRKIISINSKSTEALIEEIQVNISGDGYSSAFSKYKTGKSFRTYYTFHEGFSAFHTVKYISANNAIDSIIIPSGLPLPKIELIDTKLKKFELIQEGSKINYYLLKDNKSVALIDINSFGRSKFKDFYKKTFEDIQARNVQHLIIDLRDNGGGYFPHGNEILTYLIDHSIEFKFSRPKKEMTKGKYLTMNFLSKMTKTLFKMMPDNVKNNGRRDFAVKYKSKKKTQFKGNIYVLINNGSFSMSSYVATQLKHQTKAIFIGRETGGGEYGSNAILNYNLVLPHTKVFISLPYYFCDHQLTEFNKGYGVMPDITYENTINDLMDGSDKCMELALAKARNND